jgi:site-specific DNA-methyltransferase (adenine-specific)
MKPYHETEHGSLYLGNCLEIMPQLADKSVDLVLTDPPYGIDLEYSIYDDTEENWFKTIERFIPEAKRIGSMVIFPSCKIKRLGWFYANFPPDWLICWYKGSVGHNSYVGFNDWEPHLVYGKTKTNLCMHDYFQTQSSPKMGSFGHPCPKPVEWASWLIYRACEENMLVLDPFSGSGTTAIACINTKRRYILIEMEEKYCEIAAKRIETTLDQTEIEL